ncbi:hypothetical protein A3Q34_11245 [Colwellia sp. PAMC 20917]|uniref:sulfur carrier protein ThiS n=1 Tax=Colwellia sp. PAMC 20917 TaxID=1816218 RepID=UPI000878E64E|nr:sulfur carrier protein ThiS [Colwellia sp. PAMC 20917]AOW77384.1 hypothetical protein A3Q34_11245 [Colwellia sp. PAMC 20917]
MNTKAAITTYFINGQAITIVSLTPNISIALLHYLTPEQQKQSFAVALNGDFVGKADYQKTIINQGDSIDILFPIQGG